MVTYQDYEIGTINDDLVSSSEIYVLSIPYQNCLDMAQLIKTNLKKDLEEDK